MTDIFEALKAEFPREAISWRAQSLNKEGTSAMALAYIDARDVMQRLDEVCGPAGWQCRYPHAGAKTVCEIGILHNGEWIWKADGAGDSDIEAEKGALSDAFKRSAVRWGIGRYLYDLKSPWVSCEHYVNNKGNKVWKRWTQDPWSQVRTPSAPMTGRTVPVSSGTKPAHSETGTTLSEPAKAFIFAADKAKSADELKAWMDDIEPELSKLPVHEVEAVKDHARVVWRNLSQKEAA